MISTSHINKPKATSKDVARLAGVSQSTVSRAYNPSYNLNPELKEKVFAAAKELGYAPDSIARTLLSNRSQIIGIVTSRLDNPFYSSALQLFIKQLQDLGYQSLLFLPEHSEDIDTIIDRVLGYRVDLVVLFDAKSTTMAAATLVKNGVPSVLFNRYIPRSNTSAVCCDDYQCGYMVAKELYKTGCRNYAYVTGHPHASTSINRQEGYMAGLRENGIDHCAVIPGGYTYEEGFEAGKTILRDYPDTDAVFCSNDVTAIGVLNYLKYEANIAVPEQISIVGFDDINQASYASNQLTTVRQPLDQMIQSTISVIQNELSNPSAKSVLNIIEGEFIRRKTTRPLP